MFNWRGFPAGHRRLSDHASRDLNILLTQGRDNVVRRHVQIGEFVRIKPDAHAVFPRAEEPDLTHALDAAKLFAHLQDGVIADVKRIVTTVGREHLNDKQKVRGALVDGHADAPNFLGQARFGNRHPVLDEHLRFIQIGPQLKGHRNRQRTIGCRLRGQIQHVLDAIDFLFQRSRDRFRHDIGRRTGIVCAHDDRRRSYLRKLRHRQIGKGDNPEQDDNDRDDDCETRTVDEEVRDAHGRSASSGSDRQGNLVAVGRGIFGDRNGAFVWSDLHIRAQNLDPLDHDLVFGC